MQNTILKLSDKLPLTCSRVGTCCHGNKVMLNPWELAYMANGKKISTSKFRALYTEWCGVRLLFNGAAGYNGKPACSQYAEGTGCSIHTSRPLVCRLFPLGRQIQNGVTAYMHQSQQFPCLDACPEVLNLPYFSVEEYLTGQETVKWELAQNSYLELVQLLADIAFELLLDSGLAASGDKETLQQWRLMADESAEQLSTRIGTEWLDHLTIPELELNTEQPQLFCEQHSLLLQQELQTNLENAQTIKELQDAAALVMALALLLAVAVGVEPRLLASHWIDIAKSNGAQE